MIHAVPIQQYLEDAGNGRNLASWIKHVVNPELGTRHLLADRWTHRNFLMGLDIRRATWLDLERAQQSDPYVISLTLVDVPIYWDASPPDPNDPPDSGRGMVPGMHASRYFRLQLLETRGTNGRAEWHFSREAGTGYTAFDSFGSTWRCGTAPDRSGRLIYYRNPIPIFSDRRASRMDEGGGHDG